MKSAQRATTYCRRFIFELLLYTFWFNQLYGFTKKTMIQNLEFIADKEALKKYSNSLSANPIKDYYQNCVAITNHFLSIINQKKNYHVKQNQSKKSILEICFGASCLSCIRVFYFK
jgi:hypothetical protein